MRSVRYVVYFFRRAGENVIENPLLNMVTIGMIAVTIFIFSSFVLVTRDLEVLFEMWGKGIRVVAYLNPHAPQTAREILAKKIRNRNEVENVEFVSKQDALKRFEKMLNGSSNVVEDLAENNPLPESFEIDLAKNFRTDDTIADFSRWLAGQKEVSEVAYGREWVERFTTTLHLLRIIAAVFGGILLLAAAFIISNTIRVTLFARKEELQIMKLVGATDLFITFPFMIEGSLQGLAGGAIALVLLYLFQSLTMSRLSHVFSFPAFPFLTLEIILAILLGSMFVGAIGSLLSASRFLKE